MKIAADTNVLLRYALWDDIPQAQLAAKTLQEAELVAIPVSVLCEFVWVLRRGYKTPPKAVANAIERLLHSSNVIVDRPAVEAGLGLLRAGGDFADGVIAYEGRWLGAEAFASFDDEAVSLLKSQGVPAKLLA